VPPQAAETAVLRNLQQNLIPLNRKAKVCSRAYEQASVHTKL
jgi:hypothetical protein